MMAVVPSTMHVLLCKLYPFEDGNTCCHSYNIHQGKPQDREIVWSLLVKLIPLNKDTTPFVQSKCAAQLRLYVYF